MNESAVNQEKVVPALPESPAVPAPEVIQVWVCPHCRSWTGSSSLPDLSQIQNKRSSMRNLATENPSEWGKPVGSRAVCQFCRQSGAGDFERVLVEYTRTDLFSTALDNAVEAAYQHEEQTSGVRIRRRTGDTGTPPDS